MRPVYEVHYFIRMALSSSMYGLDIVVHANKTCYHMPVVSQTAQVGLFAIFHYVGDLPYFIM